MKFQNPSIHGSKVNTHTHTHTHTERQTDRQAESNMPFQPFQSLGHKNRYTHVYPSFFSAYVKLDFRGYTFHGHVSVMVSFAFLSEISNNNYPC